MASSVPTTKTDEDTTADIVSSIESIMLSMKKDTESTKAELVKLRALILQPDDVSQIVETHLGPCKEEIKDLKQSVSSLKAKSQMRMTMDPEFIAELKQITEDQARQAIADQLIVPGNFTPEQLEEMQNEFRKYQSLNIASSSIRPVTGGDESHMLPRLMKNMSVSNTIKPFTSDMNIGLASMDGKRNKFLEHQNIHVQRQIEERQYNVINSRESRAGRLAELARVKTVQEIIKLVDTRIDKIQSEIDVLVQNNPRTEDPSIIADIEEKKHNILVIKCKKIQALIEIAVDPKVKLDLESQVSDMMTKMAHQEFRCCTAKLKCTDRPATDKTCDEDFDCKIQKLSTRKFK